MDGKVENCLSNSLGFSQRFDFWDGGGDGRDSACSLALSLMLKIPQKTKGF